MPFGSEAGERGWRTAFSVLAAVALAIMLVLSRDFGITGDEPDMDRYGHFVYAYYRSGFADRSALHVPTVSIYGGLFELACVAAEKLSLLPRFATRHLVNAAVGWLGMVYAGRIAALAAGERAACLTLVLLVASPQYFGHCMNNPKDIPFATAYAASVCYLLQIGSRAPFVTRSLAAKIVAAIAAAIGVRFGGLLLIGYLWLAIGVRVVLSEGRRLGDAARAIGSRASARSRRCSRGPCSAHGRFSNRSSARSRRSAGSLIFRMRRTSPCSSREAPSSDRICPRATCRRCLRSPRRS
jgi:hypothetical protein